MNRNNQNPELLSYAGPQLAIRANWPAIMAVVLATLLPVFYTLLTHGSFTLVRMSRWKLMLLLICWLISGIGAILLGVVGIYRARRLRVGGFRVALLGLLLGVGNCVGAPMLNWYATNRYWYSYDLSHTAIRCASNMRQVGMAIIMYANENKGKYPADLGALILTQEISADTFICPFTNDTPAAGPTTQAVADNLSGPNHCSYIYVGKGLTTESDPNCVVLYEPPKNHVPKVNRVNFLFADGHVESFSQSEAEAIIRQLENGINPLER